MPYARGQQVKVWIDQNNLTAWDNNQTSNWQWTPTVSHVVQTHHPTTKSFNMVDVRAIKADKGAGIGLWGNGE
eukprot:2875323-Ditylum_brightwellii.AAC.1